MNILLSRASNGALAEPGPDDAQLRSIFEAAVRAPDHGKLRPWRFYVVRGEARTRLSGLFAAAAQRRDPAATASQIEKERGKPLSSPVVIAVVGRITENTKIPASEQTLSAGAAAMNILNAAHALGFGAKWVTGSNCYDPEFRRDFGLDPADQLIGFIHIGAPIGAPQPQGEPDRPDPNEFVKEWE